MAGEASHAAATGGAGPNGGRKWDCWICHQIIPVATLEDGFEHTEACQRAKDAAVARALKQARDLKNAAAKAKGLAKEHKARGD